MSIRRIAFPYLFRLAREGFTAAQAEKWVRSQFGRAWRTQVFYSDWRKIKRLLDIEPFIRETPKGFYPRPDYIEQVPFEYKNTFVYKFEVEYYSKTTGKLEKKTLSIGFDRTVSFEEAESALDELIAKDPEKYDIEKVINFIPTQIHKRGVPR